MHSILKPIIICLITLIGTSVILSTTKTTMVQESHDEFDYALRTATQDATASLIDGNYLFGTEEETADFKVNLTSASTQFVSSFHKNLGAVIPLSKVDDMNVALSGLIGYRYIYGQYSSGANTVPFSYCYTMGNKQYEFTLGDKVFVLDIGSVDPATGKMVEEVKYLNGAGPFPESNLAEHFFSTDMTNEEFKNFIIMTRINEFLTVFYSDRANVIAYNAGSGLQFNLGTVDYASDDKSVMTKLSAIIDGPGYFAVVDYFDTELDQMVRILSFGGSELLLRE